MRTFGSPFSLCLFEPRDSSSPELDKALKIYRANISPLLATLSHQIRAKVASPSDPTGCFYFAALMRARTVIGFALFGHHPSKRIIVIDHLVVDRHCRGENAFYSFAQLLSETIEKLGLEFDFIVVELEKENDYGGRQTGGPALVRLLGHIGFAEVHADYRIADLEPGRTPDGHPGILMLRSSDQEIRKIRRSDLVAIHSCVLFDHYLPWCSEFLGARGATYGSELQRLHAEYSQHLPDEVTVNGAEEDGLVATVQGAGRAGPDLRHILGYMAMLAATTLTAALLHVGIYETVMLLVAVLAAYAALDLIGSGRSEVVFEKALLKLPGGTRKSPSLPAPLAPGGAKTTGRVRRSGSRGARRR